VSGASKGGVDMKLKTTRLWRRAPKRGASTLVEYCVILVIVSIAGVLLLKTIGQSTNQLLESTNSNMPA